MIDPIIHPEYEKRLQEIDALKSGIASLLAEHDQLLFHTCKIIEAEYVIKIGSLEYKLFNLECDILRLRRKRELIQASLYRDELVDVSIIDKRLDEEFEQYLKELFKKEEEIAEAIKRKTSTRSMSQIESDEIKKLYVTIVKKLHPDLNPPTEKRKGLYLSALEAYKMGNLDILKSISLIMESSGFELNKTEANSFELMENQKRQLILQHDALSAKIEQIKNAYPYNQKDLLSDEFELQKRTKQLNESITAYEQNRKELEESIQKMAIQ